MPALPHNQTGAIGPAAAGEAANAHPESAASHMVRRIPTGSPDETVSAILQRLSGQVFDYAGMVFVVDADHRLQGLITAARLLAAAPDQRLRDIVHRPAPFVHLRTDQEHTASLALTHGVTAVPVVDEQARLLGAVPPVALLAILRHEHVEDLHRLAGIRRETVHARVAIEAPPFRRARDRLPWLLAGLLGSMIATFVVARFEAALQAKVAIAFFVPGIVYLADAIGTQTEAIAVRGLSLSRLPIGKLIGGELRTGLLIGLVLAVLTFPAVWVIFGDPALAGAVAIALFAAGTAATTIGLLFPWALARMGKDPAFGSGPIATIVQDVLSLLIYFLVVSLMVL
jgi:magnesium transporter